MNRIEDVAARAVEAREDANRFRALLECAIEIMSKSSDVICRDMAEHFRKEMNGEAS